MENQKIYDVALHLTGELSSSQVAVNADYRERAGYLLPVICRQCEAVENAYRKSRGLGAVDLSGEVIPYSLGMPFPLSAPLAMPAALGVAAMLVETENSELSASLQARFRASLAEILASLPMQCEPIADCYPTALG